MPRELIRLAPNTPVEIALEYPTGKPVQGQYGEQMFFGLVGNRGIYLDLLPAAMIASLGPKVGEPFMVVKKTTGRRGEAPEWDVYLRTERPGTTPLESQLQASIVQAAARKLPASEPAPQPRGTGTHGLVAAPAVRSMPAPQHPNVKRQYADAFALFLVDAGRATRAAEIALGGEGGAVRFDSRDLAAIATSMFIAADKAGYLQWNGGGE